MLVLTRGFKRASPSRIKGPGDLGFKNELCHTRSVLVSAHCFKNELLFLCSVLVLTHRFKNDLCVPTSVLVSTHGFKNEFCCLLGLPFSTSGLKNELCYTFSVLVLTDGTTRLTEIPSESMCFQWIRWTPSDDFPTLL